MQKNPTYYRMEGGQRLKVMVQLEEYENEFNLSMIYCKIDE